MEYGAAVCVRDAEGFIAEPPEKGLSGHSMRTYHLAKIVAACIGATILWKGAPLQGFFSVVFSATASALINISQSIVLIGMGAFFIVIRVEI